MNRGHICQVPSINNANFKMNLCLMVALDQTAFELIQGKQFRRTSRYRFSGTLSGWDVVELKTLSS